MLRKRDFFGFGLWLDSREPGVYVHQSKGNIQVYLGSEGTRDVQEPEKWQTMKVLGV